MARGDAQWNLGKVPLTIELPIEERNRPTLDETVFPELQVSRLLVLGPPWAHAELMAALLADALRFGSMDLRYQGSCPRRTGTRKNGASAWTGCERRVSSWSGPSARGP